MLTGDAEWGMVKPHPAVLASYLVVGGGGWGGRGYLQLVLKNTGQHKERERTQEIISYKTLTTEFVVFTQHSPKTRYTDIYTKANSISFWSRTLFANQQTMLQNM